MESALTTASIDEVSIPGPHGPIGARVYRAGAATAALVWLHGGAFAFGDLDMPEAEWVALTLASHGVTVCSVDYRLATDGVTHPAPGDDVLAAWRWATGASQPLGNHPVHLGGASAGACLAAATAKRIRDLGEPLPASLVLAYALVHAELPPPSDDLRRALEHPPPGAFLFDAETLRLIVLNYLGDERG
ncbi:MAG: acetyl esterase, partial [Actinomycetota bacterium]